MTREEAMAKAIEIKNNRFFLAMKDYWTARDYQQDDKWCKELDKLNKDYDLNVDTRVGY